MTGAAINHPKVHNSRKEPKLTSPLGECPSDWDIVEQTVWASFKREIPWLLETDRTLIELATRLRARVWAGAIDIKVFNALQVIMSKLGATPTDRTKVFIPDAEQGEPEDKFFH